jgi:hypothetical protein
MGSKRLFSKAVELAGFGIPFNGGIEATGLKGLVPCAKAGKLSRIQLFDGFLDVFCSGHCGNIPPAMGNGKAT